MKNSHPIFPEKTAETILRIMRHEEVSTDELRRQAEQNPELARLLTELGDSAILETKMRQFHRPECFKEDLQRLQLNMHRSRRRRLRRRIITVTASVAILAAAAIFMSYPQGDRPIVVDTQPGVVLIADNGGMVDLTDKTDGTLTEYLSSTSSSSQESQKSEAAPHLSKLITRPQFTYTATLPDGTRVRMNASSSLAFPTEFSGSERRVELNGEAFFEVAHDRKHPFIVTAHGVDIRVYGTEFNVNARRNDAVITTLIKGSVGMRIEGHPEMMLHPSQRLEMDVNTGVGHYQTFNADRYEAWQQGYFRSDSEPLGELLDDVSGWYGIRFECARPELRNILITVSIHRDVTVEEMLNLLKNSCSIDIEENGKEAYMIK